MRGAHSGWSGGRVGRPCSRCNTHHTLGDLPVTGGQRPEVTVSRGRAPLEGVGECPPPGPSPGGGCPSVTMWLLPCASRVPVPTPRSPALHGDPRPWAGAHSTPAWPRLNSITFAAKQLPTVFLKLFYISAQVRQLWLYFWLQSLSECAVPTSIEKPPHVSGFSKEWIR